jgi:hypothetical protein
VVRIACRPISGFSIPEADRRDAAIPPDYFTCNTFSVSVSLRRIEGMRHGRAGRHRGQPGGFSIPEADRRDAADRRHCLRLPGRAVSVSLRRIEGMRPSAFRAVFVTTMSLFMCQRPLLASLEAMQPVLTVPRSAARSQLGALHANDDLLRPTCERVIPGACRHQGAATASGSVASTRFAEIGLRSGSTRP